MTTERWNAREALRRSRADAHGCFVSLVEENALSDGSDAGSGVGSAVEVGTGADAADRGTLVGLPFGAKDNLDTKDLPTTANTPALLGSRPERDNPVLQRLAEAGARLIGKTNTHELALGITTSDAAFPATCNPVDPSRSPGGSSGGSGAAVAAGLVPFAIGTDTGGSVSIPAAWCGVYGLRPTTGRWPSGGVVPLSSTRDTVGVIADSVELLADVDAAVTRDARSGAPGQPRPDGRLRIGVPRAGSRYTDRLADPVQQVWEQSLERLGESAGIELVEVETGELSRLERLCAHNVESFEIARVLTEYLAGLPEPIALEELVDGVARDDVRYPLRESMRAQRDGSERYVELLTIRAGLQAAYDALLMRHGLTGLLYPTLPFTAPSLGEERTTVLGAEESVFEAGTRNVNPGSVARQTVVCLPAGRGSDALPVGISLEGRRFQDRTILEAAAAIAGALV